jgi:GTP-binding protein HflX
VPQIEVYNKIDLLEQGMPQLERDSEGNPLRAHLSAMSGAGMELLLQGLADFFREETVQSRLLLPPSAGRLRAALYAIDAVRREQVEESGDWLLDVEIKAHNLAVLRKQQDFAPLLPSLRTEG